MVREEFRRLLTWTERHRRLLARLLIAFCLTLAVDVVSTILVWLVVMSAVASAFQYFSKFWSHVDDRVKQRRHLRLLERRRKAQDAPTL